VVKPFLSQQGTTLGASLGKGEGRKDPRLVGLGERPPLGPARLLFGHSTIPPRHGGLTAEDRELMAQNEDVHILRCV
jgi:hypothetical protein